MELSHEDIHLIICQTVYYEFHALIPQNISVDIVPFENHSRPAVMNKCLQELIDKVSPEKKYILLGIGLCSNSLVNLKSNSHELIFPRVHDCIALFYGSQDAFTKASGQEQGTLYLTRGFIESEDGTCHLLEYPKYKDKFGEAKAKAYMKQILIHYRRVVLLNTGAYDLGKYDKIARSFADEFDLEYAEMQGSEALFYKMIRGQWDEDVCRVSSGEVIGLEHFL